MSPENARIFLVDDNPDDRSFIRGFLERGGHSVVIEAGALDEALIKIPELQENNVNVAVVDGNLTEFGHSGEDGKKVTERIKERFGKKIKVVSCSSVPESYGYGDAFVRKMEEPLRKLAEVITKL